MVNAYYMNTKGQTAGYNMVRSFLQTLSRVSGYQSADGVKQGMKGQSRLKQRKGKGVVCPFFILSKIA